MKRTQSLLISLAFLLLIPNAAHAQAWSGILDSTRAIDWSTAGAPAISPRSTICSTLSVGATIAQINAALSACPAGQTVLLGPGIYNTAGGNIVIPSNVTLRGSGPDQTIINETGSGSGAVVRFGNISQPSAGRSTAIISGATKGSTNITVASAAGISVGTLLLISANDQSYMTNVGTSGTCTWCSGGIGGLSGQVVRVTNVSGTTLTLSDPLYIDYTTSPQAFPFSVGCTAGGLEALKISANNVGYNPNILFSGSVNSWVKNVESDFADGAHLYLYWSLHNTVRDSFFHDGYSHGPGTTDDQLNIAYKSSANLIENNIFFRQHNSVMLEWGASGNVIGYNYSFGDYHQSPTNWQIQDFDFHGAHPTMNLFEGNIVAHFQPDSIWGSSSHTTVFRTWATGSGQFVPPLNARGPLQTGSAVQQTVNTIAYDMNYLQQFNNLVGIIAGSDYLVNVQKVPSRKISPDVTGASTGYPACIAVGYGSGSNGPHTPNPTDTTMFYHGVYNCTDGTFTWDAAHPDHTLPASFYLSAKPSWFGSAPWPAIGPDVTGGNVTDSVARGHVSVIPAMTCFNNVTLNGTINTGAFNANTCYTVKFIAPPTVLKDVVH